MKESVCSWICVTACRIEISRPTIRPTRSIGSATFMVTPIMSTIRETTLSWLMTCGSSERATK